MLDKSLDASFMDGLETILQHWDVAVMLDKVLQLCGDKASREKGFLNDRNISSLRRSTIQRWDRS